MNIYVIIIFIMVGSLLFTACRKKEDKPVDNDNVTTTPTQSVTITPTNEPNDVTPTMAPIEAVEPILTDEQAINSILKVIGERGYFIESLNSNLKLNDSIYYVFQISDSGEVFEPNVIVDKGTGEILCFYADGTTGPFSEYPLYTDIEASPTQAAGGFTKEDALNKLENLSKETLGLDNNLSEYTIVYDNWTSFAGGKQCYGINVYSGTGTDTDYAGTYYIAVDGDGIYVYDVTLDDFKEIKE
jgi:hypothetical protein